MSGAVITSGDDAFRCTGNRDAHTFSVMSESLLTVSHQLLEFQYVGDTLLIIGSHTLIWVP